MPESGDAQPTHGNNVHSLLAHEALQNQDYATAIKEFKRAIQHTETPSLYYGLGLAYERKGIQDKEEVFLKMAWDGYLKAFHQDLLEDELIDGLIRIATKLTRFDDLVKIITTKRKAFPDNARLEKALKKVSTISLLSIPEVEHSSSPGTSLLSRILIDFIVPLAGVFLFLLGRLIPKYTPRSILNRFSSVMVFMGLLLLLAYFFFKFIKTPHRKVRKNW